MKRNNKELSLSGMLGHFYIVLNLEIWRRSAGRTGKSISGKIRIYTNRPTYTYHGFNTILAQMAPHTFPGGGELAKFSPSLSQTVNT